MKSIYIAGRIANSKKEKSIYETMQVVQMRYIKLSQNLRENSQTFTKEMNKNQFITQIWKQAITL